MKHRRTVIDTLAEPEQHVRVGRDEQLTLVVPVLAAPSGARKRVITLADEGAEVDVIGLFLGAGDARLNVQLDTIHAAPHTRGNTVFKAVMGGRSALEFNGMIKIEVGAQGSNDFLQQDSLMLSDEAKANAVPGLEIEANDVKASHGATAKPVDPEQKFYLMSRGLSEQQAEAMIVRGFIEAVMRAIDDESLRQRILGILSTSFGLAI
ncbi:MAG: SufD family Fe-S cluster assembly protein [Candidatus Kerfeldbacteria bacterium]|nr:SufD family Fe-S cluster assembly protein [Candidatus Kerfeldbacteria bacterium]